MNLPSKIQYLVSRKKSISPKRRLSKFTFRALAVMQRVETRRLTKKSDAFFEKTKNVPDLCLRSLVSLLFSTLYEFNGNLMEKIFP